MRFDGPAVPGCRPALRINWLRTTCEVVRAAVLSAGVEPVGTARRADHHQFAGRRRLGRATVVLPGHRLAPGTRIDIANPYFVPDEVAVETLVEAAARGVQVRVLVTGIRNDNWLARHNSVRLYGALLEAASSVYEYHRACCTRR